MEKRLYLAVRKNATDQVSRSALVTVVEESEDKLRVRLLEDCLARSPFGEASEAVARSGEEFEFPNNFDGMQARDYLEMIGPEYALIVKMKDSFGRNGYVGDLSYTMPLQVNITPQLTLLESWHHKTRIA